MITEPVLDGPTPHASLSWQWLVWFPPSPRSPPLPSVGSYSHDVKKSWKGVAEKLNGPLWRAENSVAAHWGLQRGTIATERLQKSGRS